MICQICRHEWCWICKEDFPVHTPDCQNYPFYLEILEFQGLNPHDLDKTGWYNLEAFRGPCFWIFSSLFLIILALPFIIAFNVILTPCYMMIIITNKCKLDKARFRKCWCALITVFASIFLYALAPIVFFVITIPQIFIFARKKALELKMLCKNRCKRYRNHGVSPIMNRYLERIGLD